MSTTEILDAALSLNARERGRLIAALIKSLEGGSKKPFENADDGELMRRLGTVDGAKRRTSVAVSRSALARLHKRR